MTSETISAMTSGMTSVTIYNLTSGAYVYVLFVVIYTIYTDTYNTDICTHNTYIYI